MHNTCAPQNDQIKQGNDWLAATIPLITASKAYTEGGAVFITWDESEMGDFPIGMIVLSPKAKPAYSGTTRYTHSSMLRTAQEIFGVTPLLGDAAAATNLSELFSSFP